MMKLLVLFLAISSYLQASAQIEYIFGRKVLENKDSLSREVYINPQSPPQYKDGEEALLLFIKNNFNKDLCGELSDSLHISIVEFEVDTIGNVNILKIVGRRLPTEIENEVKRLLLATSGRWIPGHWYDKALLQRMRMPVRVCGY